MARQVNDNPTVNDNITLTTYAFTSTGVNGVVTSGDDISGLKKGQSIFLTITGGTAQGFTTETVEYFVIPVDANNIRLAATYERAISNSNIITTGDAGGGTIYPTYRVGGVLIVGTGGDIEVRGINGKTFSVLKNISDGALLPFMIKDIKTGVNTTVTDLVGWSN